MIKLLTCGILLISLLGSCSSSRQESERLGSEKMDKRTITVSEGTNMAVALSPDGQQLATDLQGTLWLLPSVGGKARAITDGLGDARQPHWSPNGKQLTFQGYWEGNWHIYTIDRSGDNLHRLTEGLYDHRSPHWSPDGRHVIFSSDRSGSYNIWEMTSDGALLAQLTSSSHESFDPYYAFDGSKVLYAAKREGETYFEEINLESKSINTLYSTEGTVSSPCYSPDGTQLIYQVYHSGESRLMSYDLSADRTTPVTLSRESDDVFPFKIQWLDDKQYIYTASGKIVKGQLDRDVASEIPFEVSFDIDLTNRTYDRKEYSFEQNSDEKIKGIYEPAISPDGQRVAFVALNDLWIQSGDGPAHQISEDLSVQLSPAWSGDGRRLAYVTDKDGDSSIWIYDEAAHKSYKLGATQGMPSGLVWSTDDEAIIYAINYGPRLGLLAKMEVSTGAAESIGKPFPYSISSPSLSPDNQIVAISTLSPYSALYREGVNRIVLAAIDGSGTWSPGAKAHTSFGMRGNDGPKWSPDGRHIAYIAEGYLWMVAVDETGRFTSAAQKMTKELSDAPSWTGDSRYICYQTPAGLKRVDVVSRRITEIPIDVETPLVTTSTLAIHAGAIFTGMDETLLQDMDIVIEGNRIIAMEPHHPDRVVDRWIDASQQYVIPGLIDIHAHQGSISGSSLGLKWLSWGVTSTRDPATNPYDALNRREATHAGRMIGPRIFFTGSPLDGNRIYYGGSYAFDSKEQLDLELARAEVLDYDFIKTYVRLPDSLQLEITQQAHAIGLPVYSHELYPAAEYGVDGVEHILGTSRRGYSPKMTPTFHAYDDVTSLIAASRMSFTPTIGIYVGYDYMLAQDPTILDDPRLQTFESGRTVAGALEAIRRVQSEPELWLHNFDNAARMIKDVHDKGGLVVSGTDGPILPFGFGLHMELECYQEAGLSPYQVLRTATVNGAEVLGLADQLGSVAVDHLADLLIIDAHPLEDIKNVRKIDKVIADGRVFSLDELLSDRILKSEY